MSIENYLTIISKDFKVNSKSNKVFLSLSTGENKAVVINYDIDDSIKLNKLIKNSLINYKKQNGKAAKWLKVDFVKDIEYIKFEKLVEELIQTRRNYVEYGFCLDKNWKLAFLPEEINANAFVRPNKTSKNLYLSEKNINNYINKYRKTKIMYRPKNYESKQVFRFFTKSHFIDLTTNEFYQLEEKGYKKGLRVTNNLSNEIEKLIDNSCTYLENQILDNGKYIYGNFPHFDKEIGFYNNLRHSSSTYALIEGLSYLNKNIKITEKPIDYLINNYMCEFENFSHIYDDTNDINEIKLGQNAAFIFAICEYLKVNPEKDEYLRAAQSVANGILEMIDENGNTIHVINYPTLSVKERYRIIYYDGEAALALLRLYQIDNDEKWLKVVKQLFEKFISKEYWRYHDHWLGYCTNELVLIDPQEKYYKFGIQNVSSYLQYIRNRETTFPTFLEMLMSTYNLVQKAKSSGFNYLIEEYLDEDYFLETIHARANYQRTGYFYPELAMYFKNPKRILNTFFIKHHGYRVRIDDVEHYISGFIQYQKVFK